MNEWSTMFKIFQARKQTKGQESVARAELAEEGNADELPTIHLPANDEPSTLSRQIDTQELPQASFDGSNGPSSPATVVATPIDVESGIMRTIPSTSTDPPEIVLRPQHISVTVMKPRQCTTQQGEKSTKKIGLTFKYSRGRLLIASIKPTGMFYNTPLRVNDRLVSINNKSCDRMDALQVNRILHHVSGICTIVVGNDEGDPSIMESMVCKPHSEAALGLRFASVEGRLEVLSLDPTGLFAHSLVNQSNQILRINDIPCSQLLDGPTAEALINSCPDRVCLVTKAEGVTAVVVEERLSREQRAQIYPPDNDKFAFKTFLIYLGPCFQRRFTRAKVVQLVCNAIAATSAIIIGTRLGNTLTFLCVSLVVVNLPWLGWSRRSPSDWCSPGQVISTLLVLAFCGVVLPLQYDVGLTRSLLRNISVAVALTVMANCPMHFKADDCSMEDFEISTDITLTANGDFSDASDDGGEILPRQQQQQLEAGELADTEGEAYVDADSIIDVDEPQQLQQHDEPEIHHEVEECIEV